jgi:hypothetical protein
LVVVSSDVVELQPLEPCGYFEDSVSICRHLRIFGVELTVYLRDGQIGISPYLQPLYAH